MRRKIGGAPKDSDRHSSLICYACSCTFDPIMIEYSQLSKLEFDKQIRTAPKPPLCKGRWHGKAVTEGL